MNKISEIKDVAIYASDFLSIGNVNLNSGKIVIGPDAEEITGKGSNKIEYTREITARSYPLLDINKIPYYDTSEYNNQSIFNNSLRFSNDISLGNIVINAYNPIDLIFDKDLIINGNLVINGEKKVRIFIKEDLQINNNVKINVNGDSNQLELLSYGSKISINDNNFVYANIFSNSEGSFAIGQSGFYGIIYAPNAEFVSEANHEHYGIIAKKVTIPNAKLFKPKEGIELPAELLKDPVDTTNYNLVYSSGYYKRGN